MKTLSTSLKALVVASLACAAGFASADTTQMTVTAKVVGTCKFLSGTNTLSFGDLDQSLTADTTKTANVVYKCTKNTASAGITIPTGTLSMSNGSTTLPFTLLVADDKLPGKGLGSGGNLTAVVTGKIAVADVQAAEAGSYTTDVTLTITN